jgi:hypothetical protein
MIPPPTGTCGPQCATSRSQERRLCGPESHENSPRGSPSPAPHPCIRNAAHAEGDGTKEPSPMPQAKTTQTQEGTEARTRPAGPGACEIRDPQQPDLAKRSAHGIERTPRDLAQSRADGKPVHPWRLRANRYVPRPDSEAFCASQVAHRSNPYHPSPAHPQDAPVPGCMKASMRNLRVRSEERCPRQQKPSGDARCRRFAPRRRGRDGGAAADLTEWTYEAVRARRRRRSEHRTETAYAMVAARQAE